MKHGFSSRSWHLRRGCVLFCVVGVALLFANTHFWELPFDGVVGLQRLGCEFLRRGISIWHKINGQEALVQENTKLQEQCRYYAHQLQERSEDRQALDRLALLLSLEKDTHFRYVYARVLRRDVQWWWNMIHLDKGSDDEIQEGFGVICPYGVVGKIHRVSRHHSVVELLTSPGFRSVVHIEGDMRPLLYEGQDWAPWSLNVPQGKLSQLPSDFRHTAIHNSKIVSSDLSGTFPDGIFYGTIASFATQAQPYPETFVQLFTQLPSLKEVIVLIPHFKIENENKIE